MSLTYCLLPQHPSNIPLAQCIRPNRDQSLLFKINYAQPGKANVQFLTFETVSGRKVLAFAVTDILPGTELLAWYGPECSGNAFKHIPLTISPGLFASRKFSPIIKENGTGYEVRPSKAWQEFASVLTWRGKPNYLVTNATNLQTNMKQISKLDKMFLSITRSLQYPLKFPFTYPTPNLLDVN